MQTSLNYQWEFLMDGTILATGIGDTFSQIVYPGPLYEARWSVTDVFANTSLIAEQYTFLDGLEPVPYCHSGLVTEIMPDSRFAIVSADMFDLGSYDNCSDQADLKLRLWHPVLNVPKPKTTAEIMALPDVLELGCLFIGTQDIAFYAPNYATDSMDQEKPDYRTTLYWNSTAGIDAKQATPFSFYTGDKLSEFLIFVEGMTKDGQPFVGQKTIRVAGNSN